MTLMKRCLMWGLSNLNVLKLLRIILVLLKLIHPLLTSLRVILTLKENEFEKGVTEELIRKFVSKKRSFFSLLSSFHSHFVSCKKTLWKL